MVAWKRVSISRKIVTLRLKSPPYWFNFWIHCGSRAFFASSILDFYNFDLVCYLLFWIVFIKIISHNIIFENLDWISPFLCLLVKKVDEKQLHCHWMIREWEVCRSRGPLACVWLAELTAALGFQGTALDVSGDLAEEGPSQARRTRYGLQQTTWPVLTL